MDCLWVQLAEAEDDCPSDDGITLLDRYEVPLGQEVPGLTRYHSRFAVVVS
ncbi:MAG: hypothetical protein RRY53_00810 [Pseudoflavonifractor sp.]